MTMIQCAVRNWGGLIACRLLMGTFEAGFFGEQHGLFAK